MTQVQRQQEFIASRYLLRRQLARVVHGLEDDWHTLRIASVVGQPLTWRDPQAPDRTLHLSLSHSHGWLLAYAGHEPLGIDIEVASERKRNMQRLMGHMALPREQAHFNQLSGAEQTAYFYTLWTQKEAYLKYTGEGMDLSKLPQLSTYRQAAVQHAGHVMSFHCVDANACQALFMSVFAPSGLGIVLDLPDECAISKQDSHTYYLNA